MVAGLLSSAAGGVRGVVGSLLPLWGALTGPLRWLAVLRSLVQGTLSEAAGFTLWPSTWLTSSHYFAYAPV
ncbi:hypothetical protein A8926_6324 [Saccharopolyspora spinosa]|uniref:Uncharacterized protein n=1 Tax=Saccharopolyspora spinosa TaxID=60894 RepID=A0A2N3Y5U9_SACSN|nr:hypothetical protein A8926_6324 [Saccharopolyspora spinosa]